MIWMVIGYVKTYLDKCKRDNIGAFAAQAAFFIIIITIHKYFAGICDGSVVPGDAKIYRAYFAADIK